MMRNLCDISFTEPFTNNLLRGSANRCQAFLMVLSVLHGCAGVPDVGGLGVNPSQ